VLADYVLREKRGIRTESRRSPQAIAEDRDEWRSMERDRLRDEIEVIYP
jgi:hypothetical protein